MGRMRQAFCFLFFFPLFVSSLCANNEPVVLVSIPPFKYYVNSLMGGTVTVDSIVPPGANPHIYAPTPRQVSRCADAVLWFRIGESFEYRVSGALKHAAPTLTEVNLLDHLDLIQSTDCPHCAHAADPHVWLSIRMGQQIAQEMATALKLKFPEQAAAIDQRLGELHQELEHLDGELTKKLVPFRGEAILVSHSAFAYFCRDYGLKQLSIEQAGKEPTARQLTLVIQQVRKERAKIALLQVQFNNKGTELVARELGLRTYTVNPLNEDLPATVLEVANCIANGSTT